MNAARRSGFGFGLGGGGLRLGNGGLLLFRGLFFWGSEDGELVDVVVEAEGSGRCRDLELSSGSCFNQFLLNAESIK